MKKVIEKPFIEKVKISVDLDKDFLKILESVAELTNSSRGIIIEAIGFHGFSALLNSMKLNWQGLLSNGNLDESKKKKIKGLLKDLSEIQKRWNSQIKSK